MSDVAVITDKVRALERAILDMPQVNFETQMLAHGGLGARTIFIPADTVLTGAMTNIDNICVVCGDITVTTDNGEKRVTGFHVLTAKAGFKRAGLSHADTWWTTIWRTDLTDAQAMEEEMTVEADMLQTRRALSFEARPELEE